jgi:hypothetical protein
LFEQEPKPEVTAIAGQSYGVGIVIEARDEELLGRVRELLPPSWRAGEPGPDDPRFALTTTDGLEYAVELDGSILISTQFDVALATLDTLIQGHIALHAPDHTFVHAGAVGHSGRAIVIPGPSFSGKTTLVAELVAAGAAYYSDEYAVIDGDGLVHPYSKPLSLRLQEGVRDQTDHHVGELGGVAGTEPLPVGLIVAAQYRSGGVWQPSELSPGEAVLELFAGTIPAQERPEQSLAALRCAVQGATALKGERGEASEMVQGLLAAVSHRPA